MLDLLENLLLDTIKYRRAVDNIFSPGLDTAKGWRVCFAEIQLCTAQLYLDYLLISMGMHELELLALPSDNRKIFPSDTQREVKLREELRLRLSASDSWPGFMPRNPFSDLTGFSTLQDYADSLTLHLPEIYEETFRVGACTKDFLTGHDGTTLANLLVGLQHLGRNHAGFVLQPLEWAADESSWEE